MASSQLSSSESGSQYVWDYEHELVGSYYLQHSRNDGGTFESEHAKMPLAGLGVFVHPLVGVVRAIDEARGMARVELRDIFVENGRARNGELDGDYEVVPLNLTRSCILLAEAAFAIKQAGARADEPSELFNLEAPGAMTPAVVTRFSQTGLLAFEPKPKAGSVLTQASQATLGTQLDGLVESFKKLAPGRTDLYAQAETMRAMIRARPLSKITPYELRGGDLVLISNAADPTDPSCCSFVWRIAMVMHHGVDCQDADDWHCRDYTSEVPNFAYASEVLSAPRLIYLGPAEDQRSLYCARTQLDLLNYVAVGPRKAVPVPTKWYQWAFIGLPAEYRNPRLPPAAAPQQRQPKRLRPAAAAPPSHTIELRDPDLTRWLGSIRCCKESNADDSRNLGRASDYTVVQRGQLRQLQQIWYRPEGPARDAARAFVEFCLQAPIGAGDWPKVYPWEFGKAGIWRMLVPVGPLGEWLQELVAAGMLSSEDRAASTGQYVALLEPFVAKPGAAGPSKRLIFQRLADHREIGWAMLLLFWGRRDAEHRTSHWPCEVRWQRLLTSTNPVPNRIRNQLWGSEEPVGHLNELRWGSSNIGFSARETLLLHNGPRMTTTRRLARTLLAAMAEQAKNDEQATQESEPSELRLLLRQLDEPV